MSKKPRIPRVSIIVPFRGNDALFEETLLSVLENRPAGCEVVVAHNGTYTDPFQLGDELRFAIARSSNLVDLVRDAYETTQSQFVHVIAPGLRAKPDWICEALQPFESNRVAAVVPTIVGEAQSSRVGGWRDTRGMLCKPITVDGANSVGGGYLSSLVCRRSVLGSLLECVAPAMVDENQVSYAFGCLLRLAGWTTVVASGSKLEDVCGFQPGGAIGDERGRRLAAIRETVLPDDEPLSGVSMLGEAIFGSSSIGEMLGTMRYRAELASVQRMIDSDKMIALDSTSGILKVTVPSERVAA
ncbi:MAG: hypothetical protein AAFU85_13505 [Planctomycetota bacterium]